MKISDIRNQTSLSLEGNLFKAILMTLFYTIINLLTQFLLEKLSSLLTNSSTLFIIIQILINTALLPFSYGLVVSLIEISKNKKISLTNFINVGLLNYTKIISLFFRVFLKIIGYVAIFLLALILSVMNFNNAALNTLIIILLLIGIIALIIKALDFVFILFVNYEHPKKSIKEIIKESKSLIKKNKIKYVLLILSYILWFIIFGLLGNILKYFIDQTLSLYITNLCFAIITPSITISEYILFDYLSNLKSKKKEEKTA